MFNARIVELESLSSAKRELERVNVYPESIPIMQPKAAFRLVRMEGIGAREANILKQEMLAAGGEVAISRGVIDSSTKETDALIMGTKKHYQRVINKMRIQPFQCSQIGDELEEVLSNYEKRDFLLDCRGKALDLRKPRLMGILNVTPDSFSDGGKFLQPDEAVDRARQMVEEGADILDIGGESSRPYSEPVSAEEELMRVKPVIQSLAGELDIPISIDTYKPEVAEKALGMGANMVNDITGLRNKDMIRVIAENNVPVVVMHMKGTPKTMQENPTYGDVVAEILRFFRERIEAAVEGGIGRESIIIDPGIGFGKTVEHNLEILSRLKEFKSLGLPVMVGPSRKSFIGKILDLDLENRLEGSLAMLCASIMNGANIVRVHDVKESVRAASMIYAMQAI